MTKEEAMKRRTRTLVIGTAVAAALGTGAGIATASGGDDQETPITGDALTQASKAALAHTGGGQVTQTEVGDEDSYYEVEVTLPDGSETDVQLDRSFVVVSSEVEGADEDEADGSDA